MDEDVIADLKQFILATISQSFADVATKDDLKSLATKEDLKDLATKEDLKALEARMEAKMDTRFDETNLKVDTIADAHAAMLEEHDKAIKQLQQQPV